MSAVLKGLILTAVTTTSKELIIKKNTNVFSPEFYFNYTDLRNKQIYDEK
jgi:hypothetical protein